MRRTVLLALALTSGASALGLSFLATRATPGQARGLIPEEAVRDLGALSQGDQCPFEFRVSNRFETPVKLRNVIKSCGCTSVDVSQSSLEPGEQVVITGEWKVGASRGRSSVNLTLIAALPDNTLAITTLGLSAVVVPDINYAPDELEFTPNAPTKRVDFSPGRMASFQIKRASCTSKAFEASVLPDGRSIEVRHLGAVHAKNPQSEYLLVETTSKHEPESRIRLKTSDSVAPTQ